MSDKQIDLHDLLGALGQGRRQNRQVNINVEQLQAQLRQRGPNGQFRFVNQQLVAVDGDYKGDGAEVGADVMAMIMQAMGGQQGNGPAIEEVDDDDDRERIRRRRRDEDERRREEDERRDEEDRRRYLENHRRAEEDERRDEEDRRRRVEDARRAEEDRRRRREDEQY